MRPANTVPSAHTSLLRKNSNQAEFLIKISSPELFLRVLNTRMPISGYILKNRAKVSILSEKTSNNVCKKRITAAIKYSCSRNYWIVITRKSGVPLKYKEKYFITSLKIIWTKLNKMRLSQLKNTILNSWINGWLRSLIKIL